jgi:hypothetical protein
MKGKRFSEEQIIAVLKEVDAGAKVLDVCRNRPSRNPAGLLRPTS